MLQKMLCFVLCVPLFMAQSGLAHSQTIAGAELPAYYIHAAQTAEITPLLLYSLTLVETQRLIDNAARPHPYTLRSPHYGARFYDTYEAAAAALRLHLRVYETRNIDVGLAQVNLHWNGHRVDDPVELLDPETNLTVAADILRDAIRYTGDEFDQIARYNSWANGDAYAERVYTLYERLNAMNSDVSHGGFQ